MNLKERTRDLFRQFGYEITAHNFLRSHAARRVKFLRDNQIMLVLDVGANEGQYGLALRQGGYDGRIVSFEPVAGVFHKLAQAAESDPNWVVRNEALGDFDGQTKINISDFSQVSSILSATGLADTDYWRGHTQEEISVRQLDTLIDELGIQDQQSLLKIDTQGFEKNVLFGSQTALSRGAILFLEVELSIRPFYDQEPLFHEMLSYIRSLDYELASLSPVHVDATRGYVLQYDCTFVRTDILDTQRLI